MDTYDLENHSHKGIKKKKKKKYKKNSIFLFIFFMSISIVLYFRSERFLVFAKNVDIKDGSKIPNSGDNHSIDDKQKRKKKKDDGVTKRNDYNVTTKSTPKGSNKNEEIRRDLLLDSFNVKKFEDDTYKLNFLEDGLMNNVDILKNSIFIFDAIKYFYAGFKDGHKNPSVQSDPGALRSGKENASEIKRLIIIKLIKCVLVLILLYIVIRLVFSFIKKLINLIFVIIFKIIKYCCCGGK
ncbi:conserved Plasmodium protein, unknown function [Plasmodium ovale]|uniref:Uncharacterized protein n=2 Tax=Plasmodium ovale TaxID=36330 RepID=A0A1A8W9S2_PLAOA|nr:conserved Plasmodium protein, unknown function [Plasmodium ovale curtisi]SCP04151.1 conserved Plasmodium protein, unknown function [Plasmodium ovale]